MTKETLTESGGAPGPDELALINKHTRRPLTAEELYVFPLILCDNEIDRDFERFTVPALHKLKEMFIGKTGIFDHSCKGKDQVARIFSTEVTEPGGLTSAGEPYTQLRARAYMPKTPKNADIITEIDAGIKKEVSVGISVAGKTCSVCGADKARGLCRHISGKSYTSDGQKTVCHTLLSEPKDAFEWSFVAVPAQVKAGVTKKFTAESPERKEMNLNMDNILETIRPGESITLSGDQTAELTSVIEKLQELSGYGERYKATLKTSIAAGAAVSHPLVEHAAVKSLCDKLSVHELIALKSMLTPTVAAAPQLKPLKSGTKPDIDTEFLI